MKTDSNRDAAQWCSTRVKGAGAWLDSIPCLEKVALSSGNFVLALVSDWLYLCLYHFGLLNVIVESHYMLKGTIS